MATRGFKPWHALTIFVHRGAHIAAVRKDARLLARLVTLVVHAQPDSLEIVRDRIVAAAALKPCEHRGAVAGSGHPQILSAKVRYGRTRATVARVHGRVRQRRHGIELHLRSAAGRQGGRSSQVRAG